MHDPHIMLKVINLMSQVFKKIGASIHPMLTNTRAKFVKSFFGGVVNLGLCWVLINNKFIVKPSFQLLDPTLHKQANNTMPQARHSRPTIFPTHNNTLTNASNLKPLVCIYNFANVLCDTKHLCVNILHLQQVLCIAMFALN
jgi:hypothetical protein